MAGIPKAEQSQRTQRILLDTARKLFTRKGYAATSTEEIVQRSGVTRGALYYHYDDKADLFKAVFKEVSTDSVRFIREKMQEAEDDGADLWQQVIAGCHAFVENVLTPRVQRILYTDGPSVLGWDVMQRTGPGKVFVREVMEHLMDEGTIEKTPLDPLVHILWGAFFEAGVYITHSDDIATTQEETTKLLIRLLAGLRVQAPAVYTDVQVGYSTAQS